MIERVAEDIIDLFRFVSFNFNYCKTYLGVGLNKSTPHYSIKFNFREIKKVIAFFFRRFICFNISDLRVLLKIDVLKNL
jgi:hypothetical protein